MKIMVITHSGENPCVKYVAEALEKEGIELFRFDSDRYPAGILMSNIYENGRHEVLIKQEGQKTQRLSDFSAIWYRRLRLGANLPKDMDKQLYTATMEESKRTLVGWLSSYEGFMLDSPMQVRWAENKMMQIQTAERFGIKIPKTIVSNDPEEVKAFFNGLPSRSMITKMQHSFAVYENGVEQVVFTNKLSEKDVEELDGLELCPMTFQEAVEKDIELRVTVVGDEIFAAYVDSQAMEGAENDWRQRGLALVDNWKTYELPEELKTSILKYMDFLSLNYGAWDFILTPGGEFVFLEVNPAGEWFWLDKVFDGGISKAIAGVLSGKNKRRQNMVSVRTALG